MNLRRFGSFGLIIIGSVALAVCQAQVGHEAHSGHDDHEKIEHNMEAVEKAYEQLKGQVSDQSKNPSSLALVAQMQQHTLAVKTLTPPVVAKMPGDKQVEQRNNFRQRIISLLRLQLDLEEQLINGDNGKAAGTLKSIHEMEESGHKEFRPEKEKH